VVERKCSSNAANTFNNIIYNSIGVIKLANLAEEIKKQTLTLMTAALGFVAALIWKDAISAWLSPLYEGSEGAMGLTIAALVVTGVAVIITILLAKFLAPAEAKEG
jgi:hypothetical protein